MAAVRHMAPQLDWIKFLLSGLCCVHLPCHSSQGFWCRVRGEWGREVEGGPKAISRTVLSKPVISTMDAVLILAPEMH